MGDSLVLERIEAWLEAGLIDEATAERLVAAEADQGDPGSAGARPRRGFPLATVFGPGVTVGEMFGYLGSAFLLAAWITLTTNGSGRPSGLLTAGVAIAVLGFLARGQSPRFGRATGVALLTSTALLGAGTFTILEPDGASPIPGLAGAGVALVASILYRFVHRALLTQAALIGSILAATAAAMDWLEDIIFGPPDFGFQPEPDSPIRVVLLAIGWGIAAVVLGVLALLESRGIDPAAATRAAITRLAAGLTAVLGTATAVFASGNLGGNDYGRLIEPMIGDAALIAVSGLLLERAFRRRASAFVYPAALGVIIGLSDLNASYLAARSSTQLALLVEGVILLAAGLAFDRLRKQVGNPIPPPAEGPPQAVTPEGGAGAV